MHAAGNLDDPFNSTVSTKCSTEMLHLHVPDMHEFGSIQVFYIEGKVVHFMHCARSKLHKWLLITIHVCKDKFLM